MNFAEISSGNGLLPDNSKPKQMELSWRMQVIINEKTLFLIY